MQWFFFADIQFLNLTWDLKVGVPKIGSDWFQGSINNLEVSLIYIHADKMVYSKSFGKTLRSTNALLY